MTDAGNDQVVYLMRGLPSCGKSYTAQKLCAESGTICETDEYFCSQVGDDPQRYDYSQDLLPEARCWNLERFMRASFRQTAEFGEDLEATPLMCWICFQ